MSPIAGPKPRTLITTAVTVGVPSVVVIVLAVVATALQVVNQIVLSSQPQWAAIITLVLVFLAGEGIRPLTPAGGLRTLIHMPVWLGTLLTSIAAALAGVLQVVHMTTVAHVIVAGVLTFLAALGYGGSVEPTPTGTVMSGAGSAVWRTMP